MSTPRSPFEAASSPEEDPTGVRALLSGLPEPDPMPAYLAPYCEPDGTLRIERLRERIGELEAAGVYR